MTAIKKHVILSSLVAIFICSFTSALAGNNTDNVGIFVYFENHFGMLCLIWFVFLVILSLLSGVSKGSLIEGHLGSRLLLSFLTLINACFIISPVLMPKSPSWWYIGILIILAIISLYGAFTAVSALIFKSYEEEVEREEKTFSTVIHYNVISGTEALQRGVDGLMAMILFSFLLCAFSFGAHWFLKDYTPRADKKIASLLEQKNALFESYKPKIENSMVFLMRDEKFMEFNILQGENGKPSTAHVKLQSENYSISLPLISILSMENTNTRVGKYKNMMYYIHNITYRIYDQDISIKAYCVNRQICDYGNPEQPFSIVCLKCDDIVVLKNFAREIKNYDLKDRVIKGPLYNADITFVNGEKISLSSPMLGGKWDQGRRRFIKVWDGSQNIDVAYDDIRTIEMKRDENDKPRDLTVIVTKRSGDTISGSHHADIETSDKFFSGLSSFGWITIELMNVSQVDFKGKSNGEN